MSYRVGFNAATGEPVVVVTPAPPNWFAWLTILVPAYALYVEYKSKRKVRR